MSAHPLTPALRAHALDGSVTFRAFADDASTHSAELIEGYAGVVFDDADLALINEFPPGVEVFAIVEDWCPDVVASLPVVARLAEAAHHTLHVVVRTAATRDIADAYPRDGRSHIPTYVFTGPDGQQLGVLYERAAAVEPLVRGFVESFCEGRPDPVTARALTALGPLERTELSTRSVSYRNGLRVLERRALVAEIHALLTGPTGAPTETPRSTP
jgi:hypothetical protein